MRITPYLTFDGNADAALQYYCDTLGAVRTSTLTYGEMPEPEDWVTDDNRNRLAHGAIRLDGAMIYASDTSGDEPHTGFAGITLHLGCDTVERGKDLFEKLAADGEIMMPFAATFWSAGFGMLTDKFGVPWMVDVEIADG